MTRAELRTRLSDALQRYEDTCGTPPGIAGSDARKAFVEQLLSSVRRTVYVSRLLDDDSQAEYADPASSAFNPLSGAIFKHRAGELDEAFWLVFLFVHFGKHRRTGWRLIADVYGQLDSGAIWSWQEVTADVNEFRLWLEANVSTIRSLEPRRGFGNHRKYQSLSGLTGRGTGAAVASYVNWVGSGGHQARITDVTEGGATATERFALLFASVRTVSQFGRTGSFDYCSMLAKLRFADIEPDAAHLHGATGPLAAAKLLFSATGDLASPTALEQKLVPLQAELDVGYDVIEDALCNWQKSPKKFKLFLG